MSGIKGITLTNVGSGYTSAPTVIINSGQITSVEIRENKSSRNVQSFNGGGWANHQGQVSLAKDTDEFFIDDSARSDNDAYNTSAIYIYEGTGAGQIGTISDYDGDTRQITVSPALGTAVDKTSKYMIGPAITFSSGSATAVAEMNTDGSIVSIIVVNKGSGYTSVPSLSFAGAPTDGGVPIAPDTIVKFAEGAGATATAKLVATGVGTISIADGGKEYSGVPTLLIESVNGEGSGATAICTLGTKVINSVTVTNAGSGYTLPPRVRVTPTNAADLLTVNGGAVEAATLNASLQASEIDSIKMTCFGGGYNEPPTVTIEGTGAGIAILKDDNINARMKRTPALKMVKSPRPTQNLLMGLTPFPSFSGGRRQAMNQNYKPGSLVMLKDGLHRVTAAESITYSCFMGIEMEITAFNAATPTLKIVDGDFDPSSASGITTVAIPKGTIFVFGDDGDTQESVKLKTDVVFSKSHPTMSISFVSPTTLDSAISSTANSSLTNTFGVGGKVTAMFIPGHNGNSSLAGVSKFKQFSQIEPATGSTKISGDSSFYHLAIGIGTQPKFISAAGNITNTGFSDLLTLNGAGTTVLGQLSEPEPAPTANYVVPWDMEAHTPVGGGNVNQYCLFDNLAGQEPADNETRLLVEIPFGSRPQAEIDLAVGTVVKFTTPQSGKTVDYSSDASNALVTDPLTIVRKITGILGGLQSADGTRDFVELTHAGYETGTSTLTLDAAAGEIGDYNTNAGGMPRPDTAATQAPLLVGGFPLTIVSASAAAGDGGVAGLSNGTLGSVNFAGGMKQVNIGGAPADSAGRYDGVSGFTATFDSRGSVVGGSGAKSLVGFVSPRIRVFQPKGTPLWAVQEASRASDDFLQQKGGWIDSSNSPAGAPNPMYALYMGTGEEQSPEFQFLNVDEDLRIPILVLTGWKYRLREVPEDEVKKMLRRSGRFNYEVIPYAQSRFQKGQDPSGPVGGWHTHVKKHKGRSMSFEEYKASIGQTTDMTNNILSGSKTGMGTSRRDPRANHRRY